MGDRYELRGVRADGSEFPVEVLLVPLMMGGELYVMCTIIDMTTRKAK
jgi:PAS domain S-box-containing protein